MHPHIKPWASLYISLCECICIRSYVVVSVYGKHWAMCHSPFKGVPLYPSLVALWQAVAMVLCRDISDSSTPLFYIFHLTVVTPFFRCSLVVRFSLLNVFYRLFSCASLVPHSFAVNILPLCVCTLFYVLSFNT